MEMHSIWALSSEEVISIPHILTQVAMTVGSSEAFSLQHYTACFASLSQTGLNLAWLSLGTICLLYYLSRPLNLTTDLTGAKGDKYFKLPAKNDAMAKEHLQGRLQRKSGKSFPIYPNGWFGILESSEIGRNEVKHVTALGKDIAVFRMSDGTVQVVSTCCPHLRVNNFLSGTEKTYIECPFHGWQFDSETKKWNNIQGAKKVPDLAEVQTLRSVEMNHIIFLWYHAEGEEPSYEIHPLKEITSEGYMYVGRFECLMDAHIEDIVQNAADNAHVDFVHAPTLGLARADLDGFWKKLISFFANLTQKTSWEPDADHPHLSWGRTEFQLELFKKITIPNGVHLAKFVGPGYIKITTSFSKVKIYMPMCITPIGPLTVRLTGRLYARPFQILMARPILRGYRNSFEQDAPIWNYGKPRLQLNMMKEEGALVNFRRWYSQFYSKSSPSLDCNKGKLENDSNSAQHSTH